MAPVTMVLLWILLWCLFFFLSLPFGVKREPASQRNFGGVVQGFIWRKLFISGLMAALFTATVFGLDSAGYFDGVFRP